MSPSPHSHVPTGLLPSHSLYSARIQTRSTLTPSCMHTYRDLHECRVCGFLLSHPQQTGAQPAQACATHNSSPCSAQSLSLSPTASTALTSAASAAPEQPLEVQQGHVSHLPPSQPCLLRSSRRDAMLLLPVLKQSSEIQGCSQIFASLWLLGLGAVLCTQQVTLSARLHKVLACFFPPLLSPPFLMH